MQRGEQLMPFKTKSGDTLEILYLEELSAQVGVDSVSSPKFFSNADFTHFDEQIGCSHIRILPLGSGHWCCCAVSRRRFLQKNGSTTAWGRGGCELLAGPSCSSVFSSSRASSTRWVNAHRRWTSAQQMSSSTPLMSDSLSCAHSGLGPRPQRACVRGAEDLRLVRLLLSFPAHHRSWLAFLQAAGGCGSGSASFAPSVCCAFTTSGQEEWMTERSETVTRVAHFSTAHGCGTLLCQ